MRSYLRRRLAMSAAQPERKPVAANFPTSGPQTSADAAAQMRRMTRRSFTLGAAAALAGTGAWAWLRSRPDDGGLAWPLRKMLDFNERAAEAYFSGTGLAPTFPKEALDPLRINGMAGLEGRFDPRRWKLKVHGVMDPKQPLKFSLDDLRAMPRTEMIIEFKCVEGWSRIMQFTGVRLV